MKEIIALIVKIIRKSTWNLNMFRCRDCGRWLIEWEIYEGKCQGHKISPTDHLAPWEIKEIVSVNRKKLIGQLRELILKKIGKAKKQS